MEEEAGHDALLAMADTSRLNTILDTMVLAHEIAAQYSEIDGRWAGRRSRLRSSRRALIIL